MPQTQITLTITADTTEMASKLLELSKAFGAKPAAATDAGAAAASAATRVAGNTATTSAAPGKGKSSAEIKKEQAAAAAAQKAADEAAAAAAADGAGEEDPFGEESGAEEPAEVTIDDLRTILTELRDAVPSKPTIVADIIKEHGGNGTAKIANIKPEFFRAVWDAAKAALPAA